MDISWETIKDLIVSFGWAKGTLTVLFWVFHAWIYLLYNARLKDRQKELDRLLEENRDYRKRFLALLDRHFEHDKSELPPITPTSDLEKKE